MKRKSLERLGMAIAAAAMLSGSAERAMSLEISASNFVGNLNGYVNAGEIASAKDALRQLQALSVEQIQVGGRSYLIGDLIDMLDDPAVAQTELGGLVALIQVSGNAYFVAGNRVISSVEWANSSRDLFPTGSAG